MGFKGSSSGGAFSILLAAFAPKTRAAVPAKSDSAVKVAMLTSCIQQEMFHLVEDTYSRVEGNLIKSAQIRDSWYSLVFNIVVLVIVVGFFIMFLYSNHGIEKEKDNIEFKPQPWLNAVRNVPGTDYGQIPQTEIRGGISGIVNRGSEATF
jgi:hypothetical protein